MDSLILSRETLTLTLTLVKSKLKLKTAYTIYKVDITDAHSIEKKKKTIKVGLYL